MKKTYNIIQYFLIVTFFCTISTVIAIKIPVDIRATETITLVKKSESKSYRFIGNGNIITNQVYVYKERNQDVQVGNVVDQEGTYIYIDFPTEEHAELHLRLKEKYILEYTTKQLSLLELLFCRGGKTFE
ncbi:hypothetical protein IGJ55_003243 [Enterococcus sp. AZ170]|uniref:hypothetical protein n=1 Tax=unclassified Enterococcus TaxID=2608891 RepID=UPI003D2699A7